MPKSGTDGRHGFESHQPKSFNKPVINSKTDMNFSSLSFLINSIVLLSVFLYSKICLTHSSGFFVDTKAQAFV